MRALEDTLNYYTREGIKEKVKIGRGERGVANLSSWEGKRDAPGRLQVGERGVSTLPIGTEGDDRGRLGEGRDNFK